MLAHELSRLGVEQSDDDIGPLDLQLSADPARRRAVVRGLDFDAAIEVHGPHAVAIVAKRREWERPQGGPLFGKHRRGLALRGAVEARVGPALLPAIEVRLRRVECLEAQAFERRLLRMADARFDFPFAIGMTDATRQCDHPVVREQVAIERVERGIIVVGRDHALAQIVEHDHAHRAAQAAEGAFVPLGPDLRARAPHEESHRFARVAEREQEEPRAPIFVRRGITDHRALAVIDLRLFVGRGRDDRMCLDRRCTAAWRRSGAHSRSGP